MARYQIAHDVQQYVTNVDTEGGPDDAVDLVIDDFAAVIGRPAAEIRPELTVTELPSRH